MTFYKNGVAQALTFSTNGIIEEMELKTFEGASWAKVFEHNNQSATVLFSTLDEAKKSNTVGKYSRLYLLDYFKGSDGKYEFLLQYPDYSTTTYNRWKQTSNPCKEFVAETTAGTGVASGYTAVHIDWSGNYWGGLTLMKGDGSKSYTYLSGSVGHGNWWYAIGCFTAYNGGIPGPGAVITGRSQLWVRIDNLPKETKCLFTKNKCLVARDFYEI